MVPLPRELPRICIVGLRNLNVLAPEYGRGAGGGAERQQVLLAKALCQRGLDVSMIVHDHGQPDGQPLDGITTYAAYDSDAGIPGLRFIHPRWTGLWSALKRADADIYYLSCASMAVGETALFARLHRRHVVFRVASDLDCDPELHVLLYWRHKALFRYGLRRADAVLAQTTKQQTLLASRGRSSRIVAPISDLTCRGLPREARDISVLWVNNFRPSKRADLLLDLARQMPAVRFDMVGGPVGRSEDHFEQMRRTAQSLPNVHFHGYVDYEKTAVLYERARLLVSTSEIEGFPNTYLQAWASGTPVVAFFDPDGVIARNGLGRTVASLDEMKSVVSALLTSEADWEAASDRCHAYVAGVGNEDDVLAPYIETFLSLRPANRVAGPRPARVRT